MAALFLASPAAHASTVAHYRFEGGADFTRAASAIDISGNGHHLPAVGNPFFSSRAPVNVVPRTLQPNSLSADFGTSPGNDAFVGVAGEGLSAVEFTNFTVEAWVNFPTVGAWQTFVGRDDSGDPGQGTGPYNFFRLESVGFGARPFRVVLINRSNVRMEVLGPAAVLPNTWYHVAVVGNATVGTLSLYVNGVLHGTPATGFDGLFAPTAPAGAWTIGRGQWVGLAGDWFTGRIDEVRISNVALSPAEFLNHSDNFMMALQPVNVAVNPWASATFTAFAAGGNIAEPLTYQWQESRDGGATWADIWGANGASYTTPSIAPADSGMRFRVVAARAGQSITSQAATVTIAPPIAVGTVAHYRFEDGVANAPAIFAIDTSVNNFHLLAQAGPIYSSLVPVNVVPRTLQPNSLSADFVTPPGNDAFVGVAGAGLSAVEFTDFTVETWVNFSTVGTWQTFVGRDDSGNPGQGTGYYNFFLMGSMGISPHSFRVVLMNRGNVRMEVQSSAAILPNTWYHVAVVGNATARTLSIYVNGVLQGTPATGFDGLFVPTAAGAWTIGRGQWTGAEGDWFNGRIDEVRISNVALSPTEFLNHSDNLMVALQPVNVVANIGGVATFTVVALGGDPALPLTYQWQGSADGGATWANISGAIGASYTTPAVARGDSGRQFRVVVTRAGVNITSGVATLTVVGWPPPVVTQDLAQGALAMEGTDFTFSVAATGLGNISFQWLKNGTPIYPPQTGATLNLQNIALAAEGTYSVVISDDAAWVIDGLPPTTATRSAFLAVAPRPRRAISLNITGGSTGEWGFSAEPGILRPVEVAGAVPVANWNNSTLLRVATGSMPLVDDLGATVDGATATWSSGNVWGTRRVPPGPAILKTPNQRLFHGFIEWGATVTITGIPFATYDVYVYPMGVEGSPGEFMSRVTMRDGTGVRELFMRNFHGFPSIADAPFILSHATTQAEAAAAHPATYLRFAGSSGSTITVSHFGVVGWAPGGLAGVSIVDTSPNVPARPVITSHPTSVLAPAGGAATLAVTATPGNAGGSLAYQWRRNGVDITDVPSAATPTLSLANITSARTGTYTVVVTETSALGTSVNMASADLVVVDEARRMLVSADMNFHGTHLQMSGHGILRTDGPVTIYPYTGPANPHNIGGETTVWNLIAQGNEGFTYQNLVDAQGLNVAGMTFTVAGATGIGEAPTGGGIDSPITSWSGPLLRDYVFADGNGVITATVGGLGAFAGREVMLVVYAVGPQATAASIGSWGGTHDDIAAVTLAAENRRSGQPYSAVTDLFEGRDLRFNNRAHASFNAVVSPAGTLSWTIGPAVAGELGMNAFNGFQLVLTGLGELLPPPPPPPPPLTPAASWRVANFGAPQAVGNAAWAADPDGDGFNNLVEYAVGANPNAAAVGLVSTSVVGGSLRLTFAHIGDPAVTYRVEAAANLAGPWTVVHTYPAFTAAGTQTYTDPTPVTAAARRFLRLSISISE